MVYSGFEPAIPDDDNGNFLNYFACTDIGLHATSFLCSPTDGKCKNLRRGLALSRHICPQCRRNCAIGKTPILRHFHRLCQSEVEKSLGNKPGSPFPIPNGWWDRQLGLYLFYIVPSLLINITDWSGVRSSIIIQTRDLKVNVPQFF